jgi:hypothetical protein
MKTIISFMTITMFALSFGVSFADEWPTDKSQLFLGTELRDEVLPVQKAEVMESGAKGAAAGGVRAGGIDKSTMTEERFVGRNKVTDLPDPYGDFPSPSGEFYEREIPAGATGAAPGGVREEASQEEKGSKQVRDRVTGLPDPYGDFPSPSGESYARETPAGVTGVAP